MPNKYVLRRHKLDEDPKYIIDTTDIAKCVQKVKDLHPHTRYKWDRRENIFRTEIDDWEYTIEKIHG